jgi:hypothetical protein
MRIFMERAAHPEERTFLEDNAQFPRVKIG